MRWMLISLAGLVLLNVVGCSCVMGHCDCDQTPTFGCHVYPVSSPPPPVAISVPAPLPAETLKELPRTTPDK